MSEFSAYLVVREPTPAVVERIAARKASAIVLPTATPWTIILCAELDDILTIPFPCLLAYEFASDRGFSLELFAGGRRAARMSAASEVSQRWRFETKPWVDGGVLSAKAAGALLALLESKQWGHARVRDHVLGLVGFPSEAWLSFRYLKHDGFESLERFPGTIFVERGQARAMDVGDDDDDDDDEVPAPAPPPAKKPAKAAPEKKPAAGAKKGRPDRLAMSREELKEISDAFAGAAPITPGAPKGNASHVDFAQCRTSREWLDAKKLVDPKLASDDVLDELERTIREGRFSDEGDRAVVVREAAAMLLGRCLKSREIDRVRWLRTRIGTAVSPDERAVWGIAATAASVDPTSVGLTKG